MRGLLKPHGIIYATILNYHSFEQVMENLPSNVPYMIHDSILSMNGGRIYPVLRLIQILKERFSAERMSTGYCTRAHYFDNLSDFEQTTTRIVGGSDELHQLLIGDIVVLCILSQP